MLWSFTMLILLLSFPASIIKCHKLDNSWRMEINLHTALKVEKSKIEAANLLSAKSLFFASKMCLLSVFLHGGKGKGLNRLVSCKPFHKSYNPIHKGRIISQNPQFLILLCWELNFNKNFGHKHTNHSDNFLS
jgi:hypothetical protein